MCIEFAVENSTDAPLPAKADVEWHIAGHPAEEVFVGKIEQRVHTPARPFIILELPVEAVEGGRVTDQNGYPEDEYTPPSSPECKVITHVCLELHQ